MKKLALLAACIAVAGAQAADKPCPPADAAKAEKAIDNVVAWPQLHKAWRDWRHCDTGAVADVYTDAILRLMVEWKNVEALAEPLKDAEYKAFIHKHLKSPAAKDDQSSIRSRASQSCPKGQDALCADIAAAVAEAK
ncbi:MAG: hypothetical protein H7Y14_12215 [Burkholderiales bacterium]|nr:hypothetical protein [Burkholderiales bacterium]